MKSIYKFLVLTAAAAAFAFIGCTQKEIDAPINDGNLVTLKFNIRNADEETTAKALLGSQSGSNFLRWEDGDKIGTFSVGSFSQGTTSNNNAGTVEVSGDNYTLNVQTYYAGSVTDIYSYYPHSAAAGKDKTAAIVTIPESQTMNASGFDADAMPMAGSPVSVDIETTANNDAPCGTIYFSNLGSIINFKVYSSTATEETITSVKYISSGNLGGAFSIDLTSIDGEDEETLAITSTDPVSEITTFCATHPSIGTGKSNAIDVYMVVAPGTYSNTQVIVTTNAHTYTLNASGSKTYARSHVKPMYVDIQNGTQGDLPAEETWTKVTSAAQFTAGTYYILRADEAYYLPNAVASSGAPACVAYTAGATIPNAMRWTATAGTNGLIFESVAHEGNYLWGGNTNNGVRVNTTSNVSGASKEWHFATTTVDGTTYYTAYAYATRYLTSYGTQDWRNYTSASSTNIPAEFYKLDDNTPSFSVESPLNVSADEDTYTVPIIRSHFTGSITVTVPNDCDWIIADDVATNANSFAIMVSENTGAVRSATLSLSGAGVTSQSLVINQDGAKTLPYEESFYYDEGAFTINDENLEGISYVWSHDSYHYMKASSYVSGTNYAAESWLISPTLIMPSLSSGESIELKFSQVVSRFFGTVANEATLMVKANGGSWSKVPITYPEVTSGNFSLWDDQTIDLSSYAGKIIQFAFKYVGTSSACGTWEIKNVSVKKYEPVVLSSISVSGQTTDFTQGDTFSFGGTVTATYSDDSTADVTEYATFSGFNMSTTGTQTVTVSYTEDGTTKTTTYSINVSAPVQVTEGDPWTYTFEAKVWESSGDQVINGKTWTMTGTGNGYWAYDPTKGQQFGSGSNPYSSISLSSNFGSSYGIDEIRVSTSGASSINATMSVSVGNVAFKCENETSISLTATNTVYVFASPDGNLKAGNIEISYTNSSSKAIYIKKISVNPASATQLVMSNITCTAHTSSSLTFGWSSVTGAIDYEVSTDGGSSYSSTNNACSFQLTGLSPETSHTIKVKAIGDGEEYIDSDPRQSEVGETDAASDTPSLQYSLEPVVGSDNGYATSEDIAVSGITWNVTGNSTMTPWRIGGKNLSGVDRAIYSKTAIAANISQIIITHGAASSVTVNSMKVFVCSTAAGAAASTPTNVVASFTPEFVANDTVTINKSDNTSWAGCYYRIVYNVTIGSNNKFIAFSGAEFYGTTN